MFHISFANYTGSQPYVVRAAPPSISEQITELRNDVDVVGLSDGDITRGEPGCVSRSKDEPFGAFIVSGRHPNVAQIFGERLEISTKLLVALTEERRDNPISTSLNRLGRPRVCVAVDRRIHPNQNQCD